MPPTPYVPAVGELVWDASRKCVGEVMDHRWSGYQLRPPAGGIEWHAAPEDIRPVPSSTGRRPGCTECVRIKTAYYAASRAGNTGEATMLTDAMGRHQRTAHP
ncbi:hypothetical protein ACIHFE_08760 [Streptomyces sp. NPDC052396]|uniref:hypothetical protein n=1 Tax=Streptomyces sp. NPDC052396 TaxID=3365689 RepID=UPI0037CF0FFE